MTDMTYLPGTAMIDPRLTRAAAARMTGAAGAQGCWLAALALLLLGYALFGKGCAYLGVPPLFVGEVVLAWGLVVFLGQGNWRYVVPQVSLWPLFALAAWGCATTLPYLGAYGIDALRDAVLWGYGALAVMTAGCLLARPARLPALIGAYEKAVPLVLLIGPAAFLLSQKDLIPNWPWAPGPNIYIKAGDLLVHLAGVLAFWVGGLGRRRPAKSWIVLMVCAVAVVGVFNRGGLFAFLLVFLICLLVRPLNRLLWGMMVSGALVVLLLAVSDVRMRLPGTERVLSTDQLVDAVASVAGEGRRNRDLSDTKHWRLDWWNQIVGYTVHGPYFWTGKGFGISLADDDGFQGTVYDFPKLRSPHNGHLTMLARAGVPGLILWLVAQCVWLLLVGANCLASRARRDDRWTGLFMFLLAYWAAMTTVATFDVYLEGPVGGLWFWTIYGAGLAAVVIYRYCPAVLNEDRPAAAEPAETVSRGVGQ